MTTFKTRCNQGILYQSLQQESPPAYQCCSSFDMLSVLSACCNNSVPCHYAGRWCVKATCSMHKGWVKSAALFSFTAKSASKSIKLPPTSCLRTCKGVIWRKQQLLSCVNAHAHANGAAFETLIEETVKFLETPKMVIGHIPSLHPDISNSRMTAVPRLKSWIVTYVNFSEYSDRKQFSCTI